LGSDGRGLPSQVHLTPLSLAAALSAVPAAFTAAPEHLADRFEASAADGGELVRGQRGSPPPARPGRRHDPGATLIAVKPPGSAGSDSDPEVAAVVRLLHRRRGWIVTTVAGVAAWLTVAVMRGSLADDGGSGAGVAAGSVMVVLLTIVSIAALAACVVDTVRLRRVDSGVRQRAGQRTAHYPARAHLYSYRHGTGWT
jgi:hypothetical protein